MLTFGLLSPNKGFESVIQALPSILSRHSNVVYIIAGATHPHVRLREGDQYRFQLETLARELGVEENVVFHSRFVSPQEMASLVASADIYITPYRYEAQAVSGTLAYALGAGKAIISTPYWHAVELLDDGRGALVPFEDPDAIATATIELLDNDAACLAMRKRAYLYAREMVWNRAAQSYMRAFARVGDNRAQPTYLGFSVQAAEKSAASRLAASACSSRGVVAAVELSSLAWMAERYLLVSWNPVQSSLHESRASHYWTREGTCKPIRRFMIPERDIGRDLSERD